MKKEYVVAVFANQGTLQGLVTATQKLNRRTIRERFKKEMEACFKGNS